MGLIANSQSRVIAPQPEDVDRSGDRQAASGATDPFFLSLKDELADKGFLVTSTEDLDQLGAHRLAHVDDLRARLLRGRDDADVDAALRRRALRLRAARIARASRT